MNTMAAQPAVSPPLQPPCRLTLFAFLWACQALVHQEFYANWLVIGSRSGWVLTGLALATLVRPWSLWLFAGMLLSSVVYNVLKWPFVVNHILVESLINLVILAAIGRACLAARVAGFQIDREGRERIFDRFAPVVAAMLIVMYYFAALAKLNWDFINADVSCVVVMYGDLLRRFPFLPPAETAGGGVIVSTLIVEAAIPLLLTFRRTRYLGVLLGVSFHLILGLVGHRTFSALAFALYAMLCMNELVALAAAGQRWLAQRFSSRVLSLFKYACVMGCTLGVALLIGAQLTGNFRAGIGPLKIYRIPWAIWIGWSLAMALLFAVCAGRYYRASKTKTEPLTVATARPAWLWLMLLPVVLNGMSQYIGLKTETCFTMYSNLRTEGEFNNHFFLPALRLVDYQDDLVKVVSTNLPELEQLTHNDQLLPYFELRRIVSSAPGDIELVYQREGETYELNHRAAEATSHELLQPHATWQAKLLYFRPVSTAKCAPCQH